MEIGLIIFALMGAYFLGKDGLEPFFGLDKQAEPQRYDCNHVADKWAEQCELEDKKNHMPRLHTVK